MLHRAITAFLLANIVIQYSFAGATDPEQFDISLNDDTELSITKFGDGGDRILWIPSEYGINKKKHYPLLKSLAALQHEVWLAEIHDSYFIPAGRSSYTEVPIDDISSLIEKSLPDDGRKLFIVSTGRAAVLATLALKKWQAKAADNKIFAGIIMLHPSFQADTPIPGKAIDYLPIVDLTQLPIFIIQPKKSNKYWYLDGLISRLTDGGSQVYTQIIDQASDGYHVRPDTSDSEKQKAKELPAHISKAVKLLAKTEVVADKKHSPEETWKISAIAESLQPYPGNIIAPELQLEDIDGDRHDLQDYRGKVVVLNFWATWCPPCVEEIPSLGRLQRAFSEEDLVVLSVDIGESKDEVEAFLQKVPADFPVLLNPDGSNVKQWNIVAFPTTFVIDKNGTIKLAYFGGLEWDRPSVVKQLQSLIDR